MEKISAFLKFHLNLDAHLWFIYRRFLYLAWNGEQRLDDLWIKNLLFSKATITQPLSTLMRKFILCDSLCEILNVYVIAITFSLRQSFVSLTLLVSKRARALHWTFLCFQSKIKFLIKNIVHSFFMLIALKKANSNFTKRN